MTTVKNHLLRIALSAALAGVLTATASPQTIEQGYASKLTDLPSNASQTLDLGAATVYFTGTDLVLAQGTTTRSLLQFPKSVFGSFTIRAAAGALLFGESTDGGIWWVPLDAANKPRQLGTIKLNYSAALYNRRWAIVSGKTGGFAAKDNDLIAIDLTNGTQDQIAVLPGASGPITVGRNGDLYYATASASFPPPKGFSDIVKFPAARVRSAFGATHLGMSDGVVLYQGIDAAGSLVSDRDGDLFLTDWVNDNIVEISDVDGKAPRASTLASYTGSSVSASGLQFVPSAANRYDQQFEPFQRSGTGRLVVHESDFTSISRLRKLSPRRAHIEGSKGNKIPKATAFDLIVKNGMTSGTGFVLVGMGQSSSEAILHRPFEAPILWSKMLLQPILIAPVAFDSKGEATLGLYNPGFSNPLSLTTQSYFETGVSAGSSEPTNLVLQ
ncbi:MAG: hypothetical protein VX951_02840 [Planctomycetota bacterium]|nr:hypothetical protein [Planctomycetota bacterium]